ncbi:MAG: class I SAM-dependent methyltransferase [Pirellulales bacterium]
MVSRVTDESPKCEEGHVTSQSELLADPANFVEIPHCSLCGAEGREEVFREDPFQVVRCEGCGLVYVTPRLKSEVLPKVYDEGYWTSEGPKSRGYADYRSQEQLYLKTFRKRFQLIDRYKPPPGRLLDVGCAAGFFLKVASEKGWQVEGVELSAEIASHAREEYGFQQVHVGTLESAPYEPKSFDLLTMWDVVEHVSDPSAFMELARRFLKPDGLLILETQNVRSAFAERMGSKWQHYKHLEHLYHFDPKTIQRLLDEAGFEILENTPELGGKHVSIAFIRERAERVSPAMRYLLWPLAPLNRVNFYVNLKDEMVIAARPKQGSQEEPS